MDDIALHVDPDDCEPPTALTKHTRFRINDAHLIGTEKLLKFMAKLKESKRKELLILREYLR